MNKHFLVLDASRGIAALAVMIYHVQKYVYPDVVIPAMPYLLHRSYLAVDLFFLMSGLVIARAYEARILSGDLPFVGFLWTRLVRLYPLYIIATVLGFIYAAAKSSLIASAPFQLEPNITAFTLNSFFLPSLSDAASGTFPFDRAAWSLAFEWAINLIYAIWAVKQSTSRLAFVVAVSAVTLVPFVMSHGSIDMGWNVSTGLGGALRVCYAFTFGIIIYRILSGRQLSIPSVNPFILLGLLIFFLLTPITYQSAFYDLFCDFFIFPIFVVFACNSITPVWSKALFSNLGRLSYALYILHNPFMSWIGGAWKILTHKELASAPALSGPPFLAAIIIGSFLATAYLDEPIRKYLTHREVPKVRVDTGG